MPNSPINSAVSGLKAQNKKLECISGNVANSETNGYKSVDVDFLTVITSSMSGGARSGGGVRSTTRQSVDMQGDLYNTGRALDLALDGAGMFIVNRSPNGTGEFVYTRACSLRTDEKGNFITANGDVLMVWKLDNEGRRPGEVGNTSDTTASSLLDSLDAFNVKDITGLASSTTKVNLGITLDAGTTTMRGAGERVEFRRSSNSLNSNVKGDDIIVPSDDTFGVISEGDSVSIRANPPDKVSSYTYGGIATSSDITTILGGIYGATTTGGKFSTATNGDTLRMTSKGKSVDFVFKSSGTPTTTRGEFNSLSSLAEAINFTPEFTARITDNKLYISTKYGDQDIVFSNISGNFTGALGLTNVTAQIGRFSTLEGLKKLMAGSDGVDAIDSGTGGIDFFADTPTGEFKIFGNSVGNKNTTANALTAGSNALEITHIAHGLQPGDYINVSGFVTANGMQMADGVYMVAATADADHFTLRTNTTATAVAPLNNSFYWSKGAIGLPAAGASIIGAEPVPTVTTAVNTNNIQITTPTNPHGLAVGDVIYLSGFNTGPNGAILENGYYKVSATATVNDFTVTAFSDATATAAAAPLGHGISWLKVIDVTTDPLISAAFANNGGTPIETTNASGVVRIYSPNAAANYAIGDVFHFNGITQNNYYNNIFLNNENSVIVTSVGANYIEFLNDGLANATGYLAAPELAQVSNNKYNKLFTELGLSTTKFEYGPAYNPEGGAFGPNFSENSSITGVYSEPLTVHDSLGIGHNFMISFGKVANNEWAVEIYSMKNPDGSYDIDTARADGQVAAGSLRFNGDGSLSVVDPKLLNPIEILWKNGADANKISFDWGRAGVPKNTPGASTFGDINGMKQIKAPSERRFLDTNGIQPGLLNSVSVNKEGIVIAGFTNGSTRKVFQIPIASFMNYNGLNEIAGNAYRSTYESGQANMKRSGDDASVGSINSQSLEKSNVDLSTQLTDMIVCQRNYQANTKVVKIANELLEALDRIL
jgi:flagellar hook-basal body protein